MLLAEYFHRATQKFLSYWNRILYPDDAQSAKHRPWTAILVDFYGLEH